MNSSTRPHRGIYALAVTAFAIGIAEFIVVGVLPAIATEFGVSLSKAGGLVGWYAFSLALGTPFAVLLMGKVSRKTALTSLVAVFFVGNVLSATAGSYENLLLGRIVTAVAHGSFFALGATVAASLAQEGHESKAIATMFAGLTLAMVIGVPAGSLIGNGIGWRWPFYAVLLLAAVGLWATMAWVPRTPLEKTGSILMQLSAVTSLPVLVMMSITVLGFGASFGAFTYITPLLTDITGFSSYGANLMLVVFGAATLAGNLLGGRVAARIGWVSALRLNLAALVLVLALLALSLHSRWAVCGVMFAWGAFAFGMSPALQSGMLTTAKSWTPRAIDFASALNISSFNLGITLGEALGGTLVGRNQLAQTPWTGVALALLAQVPLAWLAAKHLRHVPQSVGATGGHV